MNQPGEGWAVYGIDLPEALVFPVTKVGVTQDVHGGGAYVNDSPTRLDCHVHVETGSRRLEILSSLSPLTGAELDVAWAFEQQFPLALWLYRSLPCGIVPWVGRHPRARRYTTTTVTTRQATPRVAWSLRDQAFESFRLFSRALLEFHEDRQAYLVARHIPSVLEDDDIRWIFVGGRRDDANWLDAHWPVMAATDLYERARMADDADIEFLLLMMSLEVLFNDGGSELSHRLAQRCALLNGRDPSERRSISERLKALYDRRSRLVHGDFIKTRFRELPKEDRILATNTVRVSLLTLIALGRAKKEVLGSLDRAIFDPGEADQLRAEAERYWATREVDMENLFAAEGAP